MRVIAFNISSDFGFFKKFSSNTSPTTHLVPPRTAIMGLLGAIIGEFNGDNNKDTYLDYLSDMIYSVQVNKPIKKTMFGVNYQNIKDRKDFSERNLKAVGNAEFLNSNIHLLDDYYQFNGYDRGNKYTQVNLEVLKQPEFTIYVHIPEEDIMDKLLNSLLSGESYYPLFMGTTDFPLTINNVREEFFEEKTTDTPVLLHSIASANSSEPFTTYGIEENRINRGNKVIRETQPYQFIKIKNGRRNNKFIDLFISDVPIRYNVDSFWSNGEVNIQFI